MAEENEKQETPEPKKPRREVNATPALEETETKYTLTDGKLVLDVDIDYEKNFRVLRGKSLEIKRLSVTIPTLPTPKHLEYVVTTKKPTDISENDSRFQFFVPSHMDLVPIFNVFLTRLQANIKIDFRFVDEDADKVKRRLFFSIFKEWDRKNVEDLTKIPDYVEDSNRITFIFLEAEILKIGEKFKQFTKLGVYSKIDSKTELSFNDYVLPKKVDRSKSNKGSTELKTDRAIRDILKLRRRYSDGRLEAQDAMKKLTIDEKSAICKLVSFLEVIKTKSGREKEIALIVHSPETIFPVLLAKIHLYGLEERFYEALDRIGDILKFRTKIKSWNIPKELVGEFENLDDVYEHVTKKVWPLSATVDMSAEDVAKRMAEIVLFPRSVADAAASLCFKTTNFVIAGLKLQRINSENNAIVSKIEIIKSHCPKFAEDINFEKLEFMDLQDPYEVTEINNYRFCDFCSVKLLEKCDSCSVFDLKAKRPLLPEKSKYMSPSPGVPYHYWLAEIVTNDDNNDDAKKYYFDKVKFWLNSDIVKVPKFPEFFQVYYGRFVLVPLGLQMDKMGSIVGRCQMIRGNTESDGSCNKNFKFYPTVKRTLTSSPEPLTINIAYDDPKNRCERHFLKVRKPKFYLKIKEFFVESLRKFQVHVTSINRLVHVTDLKTEEVLFEGRCCFNHDYICDIIEESDRRVEKTKEKPNLGPPPPKKSRLANTKVHIPALTPVKTSLQEMNEGAYEDFDCIGKSYILSPNHDYYIKPKKSRKLELVLKNGESTCKSHSLKLEVITEGLQIEGGPSIVIGKELAVTILNTTKTFFKVSKKDETFKAECCHPDGGELNPDCPKCANLKYLTTVCERCSKFEVTLTDKTDGKGVWVAKINGKGALDIGAVKFFRNHENILGASVTSVVADTFFIVQLDKPMEQHKEGTIIGTCQLIPKATPIPKCSVTRLFFAAEDLNLNPGEAGFMDLNLNFRDAYANCLIFGHFVKIISLSIQGIKTNVKVFALNSPKNYFVLENVGENAIWIKRGNEVLVGQCIPIHSYVDDIFAAEQVDRNPLNIINRREKGEIETVFVKESDICPPGENEVFLPKDELNGIIKDNEETSDSKEVIEIVEEEDAKIESKENEEIGDEKEKEPFKKCEKTCMNIVDGLCPHCPQYAVISCEPLYLHGNKVDCLLARVHGIKFGVVLPRYIRIFSTSVDYCVSEFAKLYFIGIKVFVILSIEVSSEVKIKNGSVVAMGQFFAGAVFSQKPFPLVRNEKRKCRIVVPKSLRDGLEFEIGSKSVKANEEFEFEDEGEGEKSDIIRYYNYTNLTQAKFLEILEEASLKSCVPKSDFIFEFSTMLLAKQNVSALPGRSVTVETKLSNDFFDAEVPPESRLIVLREPIVGEWKLGENREVAVRSANSSLPLSLINDSKNSEHILNNDEICEVDFYRKIESDGFGPPKLAFLIGNLNMQLNPKSFGTFNCYVFPKPRPKVGGLQKIELIKKSHKDLEVVTDNRILESPVSFILNNNNSGLVVGPGKYVVGLVKIE